ncbi:hypothetical protein MKY41_06505 [Sporosarcina sp. FSL W7-1349]|uniref:hypothetical protein n=1 Tax=Sporosarcina sp. FSL W7-1349 TaxID=2921561 RepID=UPI0030F96C25
MSKCCDSTVSLFFLCILAAYSLFGLFILLPRLLPCSSLLLTILLIVIAILVAVFALAIILKGLARLFRRY